MKKFILTIAAVISLASFVFAQNTPTKADIEKDFTSALADAAAPIENLLTGLSDMLSVHAGASASQHNVWADAYIGKVFPSMPPHFGAGASATFMCMPSQNLNSLIDGLGLGSAGETLKKIGLPLPSANGNIRIGGIILPFDIGASYMVLNQANLGGSGIDINYQTISFDVRYALLQDAGALPAVSVGLGYTNSKGMIGLSLDALMKSVGASSTPSNSTTNIEPVLSGSFENTFNTNVFTLSAQVSKKLLFLVPYAGLRASLQKGDFGWKSEINASAEVAALGETVAVKHENSYNVAGKPFDFQVYGGLGLKFLFILDNEFGVVYDITNKALGGSISFRLKL